MSLGDSEFVFLLLFLEHFEPGLYFLTVASSLNEFVLRTCPVVLHGLNQVDLLFQCRHLDIDLQTLLFELGIHKCLTGL